MLHPLPLPPLTYILVRGWCNYQKLQPSRIWCLWLKKSLVFWSCICTYTLMWRWCLLFVFSLRWDLKHPVPLKYNSRYLRRILCNVKINERSLQKAEQIDDIWLLGGQSLHPLDTQNEMIEKNSRTFPKRSNLSKTNMAPENRPSHNGK